MRRLAGHFSAFRARYPEDRLLIVFDIDGTILDMRHMVRHVLLDYDREHGTDHFHGLTVDDVKVHENQLHRFLDSWPLPESERARVVDWYLQRRWQPEATLAAHRPYRGVLEVIRWFQLQPQTVVGLNTGRPESLRADTLRSLNALGREYRVEFHEDLLHMNPAGWEEGVADAKVGALEDFRTAGYRVFAVVDNEPANLRAMAAADETGEILFLHADTIYESKRRGGPRTVAGRSYDITALVDEEALPRHVQLVWHGLNDEWNLRQFLASAVHWGECDVRHDPVGRVVLRHDSYEEAPWSVEERPALLREFLATVARHDRGAKLDLKDGGSLVEDVLAETDRNRLPDERLWFNGTLESLREEGFRRLSSARPGAVLQCPTDFLAPLLLASPRRARGVLEMLRRWGVNRFSLRWHGPHAREVFDRLDRWGYDVNLYAVPDLESFLGAALLLPRSLTADFNFPAWHYFGRGSGEGREHHRYRLDGPRPRTDVA
jgi:hypothetical protein